MFFIYQILILFIIALSPIIILFRIFKKKESITRFSEKFTIFSKKRVAGNLIWIHVASVGEFYSIIPLIKNLEKQKNINSILITSATLSSAKIFTKTKFKKTIHQFYPIDFYFFTLRFINYWRPSLCIFIDSEIWPSMFKVIKFKKTPLFLLNARITKKSFNRWSNFNYFAKEIFGKIDIAFPQNKETANYLKKFKVKKIKNIGNLKFIKQELQNKKIKLGKSKNFLNKRIVITAVSTHKSEEELIGRLHKNLKKTIPDLLTIIIPRHIERVEEIIDDLEKLDLSIQIKNNDLSVKKNTDILVINSYGETRDYFPFSNLAIVGGSFIKHGGQNPIEPAYYNLPIIHGPHTQNFKEIYNFFNKKKICYKIDNFDQLIKMSIKLLKQKKSNKIDLNKIGNKTLNLAIIEINKILNDTIKKT